MKVCFISHFGYPLYNKKSTSGFGGGSEVQLYLLSKELSKNKNYEIFVLTGSFGNKKASIVTKSKIKLYRVLPLRRNFINYFKFLFNFYYYLIKINFLFAENEPLLNR